VSLIKKKKKSLVKKWKDLSNGEKVYWKLISQGHAKLTYDWEMPEEYKKHASKNN